MNARNMYERFEIVENEYGKANVRLLHLRREGIVHSIREFEVDTSLTLDDTKDYTKVTFQITVLIMYLHTNSIFRATTRTSLPPTARRTRCTCWPSGTG